METIWEIGVRSEVRIVGVDPEWADIDNPNGHVYGMVFIVAAEAPDGRRRSYNMAFMDEDEAGRFSALFDCYTPNHGDWIEEEPAYGSEVYCNLYLP